MVFFRSFHRPPAAHLLASGGRWDGMRAMAGDVRALSKQILPDLLVTFGEGRKPGGAWGFHESPSYPHMYCFLVWMERKNGI
jgi:hypothetical protein